MGRGRKPALPAGWGSTGPRVGRPGHTALRRPFVLLGLVVALLWLMPFAAQAFGVKGSGGKGDQLVSASASLSSMIKAHTRNLYDDRKAHEREYVTLISKLNLRLDADKLTLWARFDDYRFFADDEAPCPASLPGCKARRGVERFAVRLTWPDLTLTAGDFYLTLGRGLAISIRKVDEFGLDTSLTGGRLDARLGRFRATLAVGEVNVTNFDPAQETILPDPSDLFGVARTSVRLARGLTVAGQYVFASLGDVLHGRGDTTVLPHYAHIAGAELQWRGLLRKIDIFVEGAHMWSSIGDKSTTGHGIYGNVNLYLRPVTVMLEAHWYESYDLSSHYESFYSGSKINVAVPTLSYFSPPNLELNTLEIKKDNRTVRGFRVRVDYLLPWRTLVFVNYLLRAGFELNPGDEARVIHHVYGGAEHTFSRFRVEAQGGLRHIYDPLEDKVHLMPHVEAKAHVTLARRHGAEVKVAYQRPHDDRIFEGTVSYTISRLLAVGVIYAHQEAVMAGRPKHHIGGELTLLLGKYGRAKLFYGRSRGGWRCVSGTCRYFPSFEGFRGELSLRL